MTVNKTDPLGIALLSLVQHLENVRHLAESINRHLPDHRLTVQVIDMYTHGRASFNLLCEALSQEGLLDRLEDDDPQSPGTTLQ